MTGGLLAHSAPEPGGTPQPYADHIRAVRAGARARAGAMLHFASSAPSGLADAVEAAATFHDLGKLDPDIQAGLAKGRAQSLAWDHIDAGVAHLRGSGAQMAAWLVRAHHAPGLPSKPVHFDADDLGRKLRGRRRDEDDPKRHDAQVARTETLLACMLSSHLSVVGAAEPQAAKTRHGLALRLGLSCLVDADHEDSARFDAGLPPEPPWAEPDPRWPERLAALDAYVGALPSSGNAARDRHRTAFYQACRGSAIDGPLVACEGPVGIGKTTAVTAYLLRRARDAGLRRLVVVAPFTNVISQTAEVLRRALVLPGEDPEAVVVEHHHRADFSSQEARGLAVLWRAPVVVTTAVQLFETLASNAPGPLRKLHALPGSAIFLDEAHAALPARLWPQNWLWLRELTSRWGCCAVLASGSLARFWENEAIVGQRQCLPELLDDDLRSEVLASERQRVFYGSAGRFASVEALIAAVKAQPGPRLVILNTVQSAAVVARAMRRSGHDVLHLSTALAPKDRGPILHIVRDRLKTSPTDWTLVATSCVEAGVDLSFRTAFRERFSVASLIQTGGRTNRQGAPEAGEVVDFMLDGMGITAHPGARHSAAILGRFLEAERLNREEAALLTTEAMIEELKDSGEAANLNPNGSDNRLSEAERQRDYPCVSELGRVIDADTRVVVVDPQLLGRVEHYEQVSFRDLLAGSVQLWATKVTMLGLRPIGEKSDLYAWRGAYDSGFLGIMEGILGLVDFNAAGGAVI